MLILIQKEVPGTQTAQLTGIYRRGGPGPAKALALSPRNPYLTLREESGTVEVSKSISKGRKSGQEQAGVGPLLGTLDLLQKCLQLVFLVNIFLSLLQV